MSARTPLAMLVTFGAFVCTAALAGPAQEQMILEDEIVPRDKSPVTQVLIVEDNWRMVVGAKGKDARIPVLAHEVVEVVYSDAPRDFVRGVRRVQQGYYTKAIEESFLPLLDKLANFRKVGDRPWPEQYCLYYLGYSHLKRGDIQKGDAAKSREYFQKLIQNVPDSRFIFEAFIGIGESFVLENRFEEAAKAFNDAQKRFDAMSKQAGLHPDVARYARRQARLAELREIEMLEEQKKWELAKSAYDRLVPSAREFLDIQWKARIGSVRMLVAAKSYSVAIEKCKAMLEEGEREGQTEFLAGGYMALADCYFEKAGDAASPEDLVIARWNYIRVATLFFMDSSVVPKALFRAGRCSERLAAVSKHEGSKALEWARRQYSIVAEKFKDTPWAAQAKERLAALGKS